MDGVLNTSPLLWQRTTNDTYSGGAAYIETKAGSTATTHSDLTRPD
jgi:hypothetical protein